MFAITFLLLLASVLAADAERTNINESIEHELDGLNRIMKAYGISSGTLNEEVKLGSNVSVSAATILGLDTLYRTGDCWSDDQGNATSQDVHFGLRSLILDVSDMSIDGQDMSANIRVHNNSVHAAFTVHNSKDCTVTADTLSVESLLDVEFKASEKKYDGLNVNQFFNSTVRKQLDEVIASMKSNIEGYLQIMFCPDISDVSK